MLEFVAADALKKVIDLLGIFQKSRDLRRKEFFEGLVEPFNESFAEIHSGYEALFNSAWLNYRKLIFTPAFPTEEPDLTLHDIWSAFSESRSETKFEGMRDRVRRVAQEVLMASSDREFRRYMCSFFYYFLDDTGTDRDVSFYDDHSEAIIRLGGGIAIRTPSSDLMNSLYEISSPEEGEALVQRSIDILAKRYADCQVCYWRLRRKTYAP